MTAVENARAVCDQADALLEQAIRDQERIDADERIATALAAQQAACETTVRERDALIALLRDQIDDLWRLTGGVEGGGVGPLAATHTWMDGPNAGKAITDTPDGVRAD